MGDVTPLRRPINWDKLRSDEAEKVIRRRAETTGSIIYTDHFWEREERDIVREDVADILRTGFCDEPKRNEFGNWQVIVSKRLHGHREAAAVTVILEDEEKLLIRTVEWLD